MTTTDTQRINNSIEVNPSDNLQVMYDSLAGIKYDGSFGRLSSSNKRWLILRPGTYLGNLTLSHSNVGVKELNYNSVDIQGTIRVSSGSYFKVDGIDSVTKTLSVDPSLGRYSTLQAAYTDIVNGLFGTPSINNRSRLMIGPGDYGTYSTITVIADGGGSDLLITTDSDHNLTIGDRILLSGTAYDAYYDVVTVPSDTTFTISGTFSATDTGTVIKQEVLITDNDYVAIICANETTTGNLIIDEGVVSRTLIPNNVKSSQAITPPIHINSLDSKDAAHTLFLLANGNVEIEDASVADNGSSKVRIYKASVGEFAGIAVRDEVYVNFTAGYTDGYYTVEDIDTTNSNYIDIDLAYTSDRTDDVDIEMIVVAEDARIGVGAAKQVVPAATASGNKDVVRSYSALKDVSAANAIKLTYKVHEVADLTSNNSIGLLFGNVGLTSYFQVTNALITANGEYFQDQYPGWKQSLINLDIADAAGRVTGSAATALSEYQYLRTRILNAANDTPEVSFAGVEFLTTQSKSRFAITFDDGTASRKEGGMNNYDAAAILAASGIRATFFIIPSTIIDGTALSVDKLKAMQDMGHLIANHTYNHKYFTTEGLVASEIRDEINRAADWMERNGFNQGSRIFAVPGGSEEVTTQVIEDAIRDSCNYYRLTNPSDDDVHGTGVNWKSYLSASENTSYYAGAADTDAVIALAGSTNHDFFINYHTWRCGGTIGGDITYTPAEFDTQIAAIKAFLDAGTAEVITLDQMVY